VSNPDALNSPEVAAKAVVPWFFLNYKRLKAEDMESMSKVNQGGWLSLMQLARKDLLATQAVKNGRLLAATSTG
jgi:hypothetical protein